MTCRLCSKFVISEHLVARLFSCISASCEAFNRKHVVASSNNAALECV